MFTTPNNTLARFLFFLFIISCAVRTHAQVPSYVPTAALLAWYPFNNNANNSFGSGNNGVAYGGVTYGVNRFGAPNSCYTGNGSSGIDIPGNSFPSGNSGRTVTAWFKNVLPYAGGYREIFATGSNSAAGRRFGLHCDGSHVGFESVGVTVQSPFVVDSAWHHLAVSYPSIGSGTSSVKVYVDGMIAPMTITGSLSSLNTDTGIAHNIGILFFPAYWGSWLYSWTGSLDDIGVWARDLNPCEIAELYAGASAAIVGASSINVGATIALTDSLGGGMWTSSNPAIALVGSASGVVLGAAAGTATITYTRGTCYAVKTVTVNSTCGTGIIYTIAGNGVSAFSGDGGLATAASLFVPYGITEDNLGNICIGDGENNRIRKINASGIITTVAGTGAPAFSGDGGPATAATFYGITGVVYDAIGNLYVADQDNQRIRKIDTAGIITSIAGSGPTGIFGGGYSGDGGPATAARLNYPTGMAIDRSGNFYIADQFNNRVRKIDVSGIITTVAGTGVLGFSGDGGPATAAQLDHPCGIAFDPAGNMYITDYNNHRIRKMNTSGVITTFSGGSSAGFAGDGGPASAALFHTPWGITADASGNVYVSDATNNRVRKIDASGIISTIAGTGTAGFLGDGGPAVTARLSNPTGIYVNDTGYIYISDLFNERIRRIGGPNHIPKFTGGRTQTKVICSGTVVDSMNTLLAVLDTDYGQAQVWSVVTSPAHGTLFATYSATSTGAAVTPRGLYYLPATGYIGTDTFKVRVYDCFGKTDTTTICMLIAPSVSSITGASTVCSGSSIIVANATTGGVWSSSNVSVATVGSSTGVVTGASAGTVTISYYIHPACVATKVITVQVTPAPITGASGICTGGTTTLSDATAGGAWSGGAAGIAVVAATTGIVFGIAAGSATITYSLGSCYVTKGITVDVPVPAISGPSSVCAGSLITLSNSVPGGAWISSSAGIAAVGSSSGVVSGISMGGAVITYMLPSGCYTVKNITVNPTPVPVSGSTNVCLGTPVTLASSSGGVWATSAPAIAVVGSSTGTVSGVSVGTAIITYTLPTGCFNTTMVTVNSSPAAITGTAALCNTAVTTLSNTTPGGYWASGSPGIASVGSGTGVVTGVSTGTATISYIISSGCAATRLVTVNLSPSSIMGVPSVCAGSAATLVCLTVGGIWSSGSPFIATVGSFSGVVSGVTAGTATISYTLPTGCYSSRVMTVNPAPSAITGSSALCVGATMPLSSVTPGGFWTSSHTATANVDVVTGVVNGLLSGTTTITYTLSATGCYTTKTVTVSSGPSTIIGPATACVGANATLVNGVGGGTWSSSATTTATINPATGIYTGVAAGTATITYSLGTGCFVTRTITINPSPAPIGGTLRVCTGGSTTLTDATPGGIWSASSSSTVSIGLTTGFVVGGLAGTATISYTVAGCSATAPFTVNPLPATITGTFTACPGTTTTLASATGGGSWASSAATIATAGSTTGIVAGVAAGAASITYTLPTGCYTTRPVTINPNPTTIVGASTVCVGANITLSNGTAGGTWSRSNSNVTISGSGATMTVTGITAGPVAITYTLPTGCYSTKTITVNTTSGTISGTLRVCIGSISALSTGSG
ncbi:MAG: hypothetical protein K0Q79_3589, partial [Flavipsychrobacter sp.]|nr:hypothetical protein [Flavipsychrobacter sp.]